MDDDYREVEEGFLSPDFECLECGKVFRSRSLEPRCPKCGGYDIDIAKGTLKEGNTTKCKKCGKVSTFGYDGWCKDCWEKDDDTDYKEIHVREEYGLTTYFAGNDKDGWVLMHQGQPLNANPQGGIPVDRERVQRVAKQFGFKNVMVWNGKNYTYAFESYADRKDVDGGSYGDRQEYDDEGVKCTQCKKSLNPVQALMGPVCGDCTRKNHAAATKGFDKAYTKARGGK